MRRQLAFSLIIGALSLTLVLGCQPFTPTDSVDTSYDDENDGSSDDSDSSDDGSDSSDSGDSGDAGDGQYETITVSSDSFTLAWDSPQENVDGYNVYYRAHGDSGWSLLAQTDPGSDTTYQVSASELSYGTYDFAVSSVDSGTTSDKHTSLDDAAQPSGGWYIEWTG
jgi:hypothetical protein